MKNQRTFIDTITQNRVISHLFFWVGLVLMFTTVASINSGLFRPEFFKMLGLLPAQVAAAYLLNYYQVPQLLYKKRTAAFILSLLVSVYMFSVFGRWCVVHFAEPFFRTEFDQESIVEILSDIYYLFLIYFPTVYTYGFIMLTIKAIKNRFQERHEIEVLQKEKAKNELKFLKAQIQPHFLFNTLNNIYALTLSKSDLAPQMVLKLSELLDFILYESDKPTIPIEKEVELIKGFIDLESLRYGELLDLNFKHSLDRANIHIAPLLLLPLVENAFKHGSGGSTTNTQIEIDLVVLNEALTFTVYNSKPSATSGIKIPEQHGIGTSNLQRQLELHYPEAHTMQVEDSANSYKVTLTIDLT